MASWVLADLVRIFHGVSTDDAQKAVNEIIEWKHPLIWEPDAGLKRVLVPGMKKSDQMLVLLHQKPGWVPEDDIIKWVEYSHAGMFRKTVLNPAHEKRLIEYDQKQKRVRISPLGIDKVEKEILPLNT